MRQIDELVLPKEARTIINIDELSSLREEVKQLRTRVVQLMEDYENLKLENEILVRRHYSDKL